MLRGERRLSTSIRPALFRCSGLRSDHLCCEMLTDVIVSPTHRPAVVATRKRLGPPDINRVDFRSRGRGDFRPAAAAAAAARTPESLAAVGKWLRSMPRRARVKHSESGAIISTRAEAEEIACAVDKHLEVYHSNILQD